MFKMTELTTIVSTYNKRYGNALMYISYYFDDVTKKVVNYEDDFITFSYNYKNNKLNGYSYGPNQDCYYVNGQYHGPVYNWFDNGLISGEQNYKNGLKHGREICYDEQGKVWLISRYVEGKLSGIYVEYDYDGTAIHYKYVNSPTLYQII